MSERDLSPVAGPRELLRLRSLFGSERPWMLAGFAVACATLVAGLALLGLSGGFLAAAAIAGLTPATALAFNFFPPAAGVRFLAIARTAGRWGERVLTHEATLRLLARLRSWLYRGVAELSPRQLGRYHGADLLNHLTRDIDALDNLYLRFGVPYLAAWTVLSMLAVSMAWWSPVLSLPVVALMMVSLLVLPWLAWGLGGDSARRAVEARSRLRRRLLDCHDGADDFSLHDAAWRHQREATLTAHRELLTAQRVQQRRAALLRAMTGALVGFAVWAVLVLAAGVFAAGALPAPWLAALPLLLLGTAEALLPLSAASLELPGTAAAATRLRALVSQSPATGFVAQGPMPGGFDLRLENLTHGHGDQPDLFVGLDAALPAGRHVALLGPSGGGKSTLLSLIARLEDPRSGRILLGSRPLTELDETTLRASVALLAQDAWVFSGTLADNLRVAAPDAEDEALWSVLHCVGLSDTVSQWPEGLATWVDEGGGSLSGGQRRRLALARVLLREAPVTLLDEPAEGLDAAAEADLVRTVRRRLAGRTLVWVTHRPETARAFEHALRLESGRLCETTAHP